MGRGDAPAREISFVSLVAYGPKVSHSALAMGVTVSETRQGSDQQKVYDVMYSCFKFPHSFKYPIQKQLFSNIIIAVIIIIQLNLDKLC